jgi:hypothetical protein
LLRQAVSGAEGPILGQTGTNWGQEGDRVNHVGTRPVWKMKREAKGDKEELKRRDNVGTRSICCKT